MAPARDAAVKMLARNSSELPKNTVEKNRSSWAPRRSRSTPMNQRKATPANGTRFNASITVLVLPVSQTPDSRGSAGIERRSSHNITIISTAKTMPATAAAFGVFRRARTSDLSSGKLEALVSKRLHLEENGWRLCVWICHHPAGRDDFISRSSSLQRARVPMP
jgi:hypothetical protein